ncbi:MAG: M15 family metallopeptidase [Candidatus Nanopelagicales bacterium]
MLRPGPLPTYDWASVPADIVPGSAIPTGLAPVTAGDPDHVPDAPPPEPGDLVLLGHPRVRLLSAYWHEGWAHARSTTWLRPAAAERLYRAVGDLPEGFGVAVWDAWRDPALQAVLHDTVYRDDTLPEGFVAYPDPDPARCPPHASGGTVDLTLTWHLRPLALGTRFDAFVPEAAATALEPDGPTPERDLRRLLAAVMSAAGFVVHPQEWWHWEYGTRWWAAVTGERVRYGRTAPPS